MTSFPPTSNPSPISGRLGHQKVHWERSRTSWVKNPKHLEASRSIFSSQCMQNRHLAIRPMQTFISPKDISSSRHQNLGGAERDRTADPLLAKQVLSQLSYSPIQVSIPDRFCHSIVGMVGPGRLELPTSRLSGVRSNHLSYGPITVKHADAGVVRISF